MSFFHYIGILKGLFQPYKESILKIIWSSSVLMTRKKIEVDESITSLKETCKYVC